MEMVNRRSRNNAMRKRACERKQIANEDHWDRWKAKGFLTRSGKDTMGSRYATPKFVTSLQECCWLAFTMHLKPEDCQVRDAYGKEQSIVTLDDPNSSSPTRKFLLFGL